MELGWLIEHRRWIRGLCECRNSRRIPSLSGSVFARGAAARRPTRTLARGREKSADAKDRLLKRHAKRASAILGFSKARSCLLSDERRATCALARLLPVRPLSAVLMLLFTLGVEPSGNVARWNRSSWSMRNDCAGEDDQSFAEFRPGEVLGFRFGLKCPGYSRASPFQQCTALVHLKSNVPGIRHLS